MESSLPETLKRARSDENLPELSPKKIKSEENAKRKEEEIHFLQLKKLMLNKIADLKKVSDENIASVIPEIKQSFCDKFMDIDLSDWKYLCAYLFRYGAHGAGLTRCRTLEALRNCEDFVSILQKTDLNIISLGCGPGLDIVGLCSALCEYQIQSKLNITLLDSVTEWLLCKELMDLFISEVYYGKATEIIRNGKLSFIRAKLPLVTRDQESKVYFQILRDADIFLMTKFISSLDWDDKNNVVQEIHDNMKDEALILFIDSPFMEDLWEDFEILYLSEKGDEYRYRSLETEENFGSDDNVSSKARVAVMRKKNTGKMK